MVETSENNIALAGYSIGAEFAYREIIDGASHWRRRREIRATLLNWTENSAYPTDWNPAPAAASLRLLIFQAGDACPRALPRANQDTIQNQI